MKTTRAIAASLTVVLVGASVAPAGAEAYRLDPERSELLLRVFKGGFGKALAHDHVIRAGVADGSIAFDPENPEASSVEVVVDAAALQADEPAVRARLRLPAVPEDARKEIQHTMRSAKQLDVTRYPDIRFHSTEVTRIGAERFRITGPFTLHGESRSLTFPASVRLVDDRLEAEATLRFDQSAFGIEPYSAALGAVKNKDEVELIVRLVGEPSTMDDRESTAGDS